jgi:predicted PurR-regulated permease PerM
MSVPAPESTNPWKDSLGRASLRCAQVLLMLLLAVVLVYALIQVRLVVIPMLLALILAAAIVPLVHWLRRKGWPASAATGFSFLLLLLLFGGLITGIVFASRASTSFMPSLKTVRCPSTRTRSNRPATLQWTLRPAALQAPGPCPG